jgi:hypothetical protein
MLRHSATRSLKDGLVVSERLLFLKNFPISLLFTHYFTYFLFATVLEIEVNWVQRFIINRLIQFKNKLIWLFLC